MRRRTLDERSLPVIIADSENTQDGRPFVNLSLVDCGGADDGFIRQRDLACKKRLPQVIGLIGGKRDDATELFFLLSGHPALVTDQSFPKSKPLSISSIGGDVEQYKKSMPVSSKFQLTMDISPDYFFEENAPRVFRDIYKGMKFVVVLSDPVVRVIDEYRHVISQQGGTKERVTLAPGLPLTYFINDTLESSVISPEGIVFADNALVSSGMYDLFLERWLVSFPADQFFVVENKAFNRDPLPHLRRLERFLGLPKFFEASSIYFDDKRMVHCRQTPERTCPPKKENRKDQTDINVSAHTTRLLREFYQPHTIRLEQMLGQRFSWTNL
ncbi:heparan sulfate glucosamine 3-O-sulfotransferase 2-like [Diadema antillarum]|uniref:heparan sulfate glucosamine 3-O-sulfotransferase 2-like n=1 Tax=Diadema antillarum TaxID=105358 RepID=UPI003A84A47B